ncbi:hypothetical protein ATCC90586_005486 [Pythium insidiosum]|nr:hypothetical protein ATCC90586_005486 [Pythium insidiosum]
MLDIYPRAAFDIYNKIKMTFPHDVDELCEEIHKACKGLGTDEKTLVEILGPRSARQRTLVGIRYKELYNQSLLELIRSETSGDLGFLLRLIVMPLPEAEAYILNKACKGVGTTENLIYPIIVGRPTEELDVLKKAYFAKYDEDLAVMLNGELSGDFSQIIMTSLQAPVVPYNPSFHTKAKAAEDAEALYKAGEGKWGTDEKSFLKILLAAPAKYIQMLDAAYTEKYGHGLLKAIAAEFSGSSKNALDYLVRLVLDPYDLIAEKIEGAMKGFGTDEQKLSAYLVRYHKYQAKIEQAYEEKYKTTLRERIKGEASGDYLALLNHVMDAPVSHAA